jgi:hypothetical protein
MSPEDWRVFLQQTGVLGICVTVFLIGFRRRWWVPGSEIEERDKRFADVQKIADRFMDIADRAIAQVELLTKRVDE